MSNNKYLPNSVPAFAVQKHVTTTEGESKWVTLTEKDLFEGKNVVIFGLPGAFTPTCSTQQLPGYEEAYQGFRDLGIDDIYCFTVNDTFVTQEWAQSLGIVNVKVIPDGSAEFTVKMNMDVRKDNLGFGLRSWRYAALVESGRVSLEFVEEGFGDNIGDDPYIISNPYNVMEAVKQYHIDSTDEDGNEKFVGQPTDEDVSAQLEAERLEALNSDDEVDNEAGQHIELDFSETTDVKEKFS